MSSRGKLIVDMVLNPIQDKSSFKMDIEIPSAIIEDENVLQRDIIDKGNGPSTSGCQDDDSFMEPYSDSSSSYKPPDSESSNDSEASKDSEASNYSDAGVENENINVPKKKKMKKADKTKWRRYLVKKLRLSGKKYVNRKGNEIAEKKPLPSNCTICRFKCNNNFSEIQRAKICEEYWNLSEYRRQKIYMSSLLKNVPVHRKAQNIKTKSRSTSREFFLPDEKGNKKRVCPKFFCATFSVSHRVVETCAKSISTTGLFTGYDKREDSKPYNATPEVVKNLVRTHIDSFPRIESHYYTETLSQKLYLSADLNLAIMYRLYINDFCAEQDIPTPVSRFMYQQIFHEYEPALSFYTPKKDQCFRCNVYQTAIDKIPLQEEFESHKKREKDSMKMKADDKKKASDEKGETFRSISFDLEAILPVPYAGDNQIYYKSKLNVYNFTIFDASNSDGHCFVWDETNGSKGSSEIGSCLLKYLWALPKSVKHAASFSDTCGGQNRNKYVASAMLYAVSTIDHLETIDLKFMETGHSYLEADSMHASIERAKRHKKIYSTREWALLISTARIKPRPYNVSTLSYEDFYDLKILADSITSNTRSNTNKEKVQWLKIKWMRFNKDQGMVIQYKYDLYADFFFEIDVASNLRSARSGKKKSFNLTKKYAQRLSVSKKKKQDLLYLLSNKIIPQDYSQFINEIPAMANVMQHDSDSDIE